MHTDFEKKIQRLVDAIKSYNLNYNEKHNDHYRERIVQTCITEIVKDGRCFNERGNLFSNDFADSLTLFREKHKWRNKYWWSVPIGCTTTADNESAVFYICPTPTNRVEFYRKKI